MDSSKSVQENSFLGPLLERREDEPSQSTPIKRHRAEISEDDVEVFDSSCDSAWNLEGIKNRECGEEQEIEVFDATFDSIGSTRNSENLEIPVLNLSSEVHDYSLEVFDSSNSPELQRAVGATDENEMGADDHREARSFSPYSTEKADVSEAYTFERSSSSSSLKGCNVTKNPSLTGKRVFINLDPCDEVSKRIKKLLCQSGAHLAEFLDKNVNLIIVDKRRSKPEKLPSTISASHSRVSRMINASLVEKNCGSSSVEVIGRKWNIPIYDFREFITSIQSYEDSATVQYINTRAQVKKLKDPFIKVEDRSRSYRPEFVEMKTFPSFDFETISSQSPFQSGYNENVPKKEKKARLLKRNCELCLGSYFDLDLHLTSARHIAAANDDTLFSDVDELITRGVTFQQFKEQIEEIAKSQKQ